MKKLPQSPKKPQRAPAELDPSSIYESAAEEDNELQVQEQEEEAARRQPELTDPQLETLTKWDEPLGQFGRRVPPIEPDDESWADEELAEEGLNIAEDELRDVEDAEEAEQDAEFQEIDDAEDDEEEPEDDQ